MRRALDRWRLRRVLPALRRIGVEQAAELDRLRAALRAAEARLGDAAAQPERPPGSLYACRWRFAPDPGAALGTAGAVLGPGLTLWHDCPLGHILPMQAENGLLALQIYEFSGSYLSLSARLPDAGLAQISRESLLRVQVPLAAEGALWPSLRLNLRHGPNVEQMSVALQNGMAEFDLYHLLADAGPVREVWLDLILGTPRMMRIDLQDFTLSHGPRGGF